MTMGRNRPHKYWRLEFAGLRADPHGCRTCSPLSRLQPGATTGWSDAHRCENGRKRRSEARERAGATHTGAGTGDSPRTPICGVDFYPSSYESGAFEARMSKSKKTKRKKRLSPLLVFFDLIDYGILAPKAPDSYDGGQESTLLYRGLEFAAITRFCREVTLTMGRYPFTGKVDIHPQMNV